MQAALEGGAPGAVDRWLQPIRETAQAHRGELDALPDPAARRDRLGELNVARQVRNVASEPVVRAAWARGQPLDVHGWMYALADGRVTDLGLTVASARDAERLEAGGDGR